MWLNPQFPADLDTFTEKTLIENFIPCQVSDLIWQKTQVWNDCKKISMKKASLKLVENTS